MGDLWGEGKCSMIVLGASRTLIVWKGDVLDASLDLWIGAGLIGLDLLGDLVGSKSERRDSFCGREQLCEEAVL